MNEYSTGPKRIVRCCQCAQNKMCFITENDKGDIEFYCEYCHATVPVKKLKTRSRKTDALNFTRSIKILTKYPRISYG